MNVSKSPEDVCRRIYEDAGEFYWKKLKGPGSTWEWFLTIPWSDTALRMVLKCGTVPVFQGGLVGRLSLLSDILHGAAHRA